ncbi:MAG: tetratricopeptide repeat protein [Polyangiales bacterium]
MRATLASGLLFALVLAVAPSRGSAQSFEAVYARAHQAFDAHRYEDAARLYEALVAAGVDDADVYFDLGTAYAEAGRYGKAMVAFERSLSVRPSDPATDQGLSQAEALLARRRAAREGEATTGRRGSLLDALGRTVPEGSWALLVLALSWLAFLSLAVLVHARRETLRLGLGITASVASLGLAFATVGLGARLGWFREGRPAIVVEPRIELREAPDDRARALGAAEEGERVEVLSTRDGYARIRVPGRGRGWVPESDVGTF